MSILQYRSSELMSARYKDSEAKNQGSNLTFANKGLDSSHGMAFQQVSSIKDDITMAKAVVEVDSAGYFDDLLSGEPDSLTKINR